ncbi:CMP-binding protein [Alkalihalobacillus sp. MEB130]|uniref:3'-5' exoribonuclease YhaM family protein n=1 Tax=Alkalihalobacillus sp. MEB130 TaxID=2976704 RepID=UPI0028DFFFA4|nr:CMP-binding protein [Alkalihalobacillus sp. MEB130]MDT8859392.1 CMP-binding protein [Alkalihalobacillus sp. MEB130]
MLQLHEGETITSFFLIKEREIKQAANGSDYANFKLERNLVMIPARLWDITNEQKKAFQRKTIVKVEGTVMTYREKLHLNIQRIRLATEEDQVNVSELISKKGVQREVLWQEFRLMMEEVDSQTLRSIIRQLFSNKGIRERMTTIPASKNYHHTYYAGLLDHIVHVTQSAMQLLPLYPNINKDIIIATCLTHEVGKTEVFTEAIAPEHSTAGELLGHIALSLELVQDAAKEAGIQRGNDELLALKHCIASQYGERSYGYGSTASPKTAEAIFFHHLKQMNATLQSFEVVQVTENEEWVYSPILKRKLFVNNDYGSKEG